ncbi:NUDIX domain-containing protein [bacterium]
MRRKYRFCPNCGGKLQLGTVEKTKERLLCSACNWVYYNNPLPVAIALTRNKNGDVLLVKRGICPGFNKWALPGGFIDMNEKPDKACLRELKEETGIRGKVKRLIGIYLRKTIMYGALLVIGYEVEAQNEKIDFDKEIKDVKFFPITELPKITFPVHKKFIKEVLKSGY